MRTLGKSTLCVLFLAMLSMPSSLQADSLAQMQLAELAEVRLSIRVDDLARLGELKRSSLAEPIEEKVAALLAKFGLSIDQNAKATFMVRVELYKAGGETDVGILAYAALREEVELLRDPGTRVPGGGLTWWDHRFSAVPAEDVSARVEEIVRSLAEEFARDATVARELKAREGQ